MHIFKRSKSQSRDESIKCENKNTYWNVMEDKELKYVSI